mmetsp:Transcript_54006/g.145641  ORF Transcript_54006/g.145641 Transcript_54006/m.145641 type:complete len:248 (-) Transcript_54006:865-1608(-)
MVRCAAATSSRARCSRPCTFCMRSLVNSRFNSTWSQKFSKTRISRYKRRMSLDRASPRSLRMPFTNSCESSSPSPSSRISQSSSMSLATMSSFCSFCRTFLLSMALVNSDRESFLSPSVSILLKRCCNSRSSFSISPSISFARSVCSFFESAKACSTMTAVMRFISTNSAMEMKTTKNSTTHGCLVISGRMMLVHESSVITWKSVIIESSTSPKCSCASSSSRKVSDLPMREVAIIAKKYRTQPIMT